MTCTHMARTRAARLGMTVTQKLILFGAALLFTLGLVRPAVAENYQVLIGGVVDFNLLNRGVFAGAEAGDPVALVLTVDSDQFTDSPTSPLRGYPVSLSSLSFQIGSTAVGVDTSLPTDPTPLFSLQNDDPATGDGFFLSEELGAPNGVPLDATGDVGTLEVHFSATYGTGALGSLDIQNESGSYNLPGLIGAEWVLTDGSVEVLGVTFWRLRIILESALPLFVRGDCNADGLFNIADAVHFLANLIPGPGIPPTGVQCQLACDANDDSGLNIADGITMLGQLFGTATTPIPPPTGNCGIDPTDGLISCDLFPGC